MQLFDDIFISSGGAGEGAPNIGPRPPIEYIVSSGQTSSGLTEDARHVEFVLSGGIAVVNSIDEAGQVYVSYGGETVSDTIYSGGTEYVSAGGLASGVTVSSGGELIGAGSVGGEVQVFGTISGLSDDQSSQPIQIESGGAAIGLTVSGAAAGLDVTAFGSATSTTVVINGSMVVSGVASGIVETAGQVDIAFNGYASGIIDTFFENYNDVLTIRGNARDVVVTAPNRGNDAAVDIFEEVDGLYLSAYAIAEVFAGGDASDVTLRDGGKLIVSAQTEFTTDAEYVKVLDNGTLLIAGSAFAYSATVAKGGLEVVSAGGTDEDGSVRSGGVLSVLSGSLASHIVISGFDAVGIVDGGTISASVVRSGGEVDVSDGGVASSCRILSGGTLAVLRGGETEFSTVSSGGIEVLLPGANVDHTHIFSGGTLSVTDSGYALSSLVHGGEVVSSGGNEFGATVYSGGVLDITSGGGGAEIRAVAGGIVIDDGYLEYGEDGRPVLAGVLSGSGTVNEEGYERLVLDDDGSAFTGQLTIGGHLVELASADPLGAGSVVFYEQGNGDPTLQIDATTLPASGGAFANVLSNFDEATERLDLSSMTFTSGATVTLSGTTLTLEDGGYAASFDLAGTAARKYVAVSDGAGGTLIHAAVGSPTAPLVQAVAGFTPSALMPAEDHLVTREAVLPLVDGISRATWSQRSTG